MFDRSVRVCRSKIQKIQPNLHWLKVIKLNLWFGADYNSATFYQKYKKAKPLMLMMVDVESFPKAFFTLQMYAPESVR